jgi:hypothetical protein
MTGEKKIGDVGIGGYEKRWTRDEGKYRSYEVRMI